MTDMKTISDAINDMQRGDGQPTEREIHGKFFEALLLGQYQRKYIPGSAVDLPPTALQVLNRDARWFRGALENARIAPPQGATPDKIVAFYAWYRAKHATWDIPLKWETILNHWAAWEIETARLSKARTGSMVAVTSDDLGLELNRFDRPDYSPVTGEAVDELIARLKGRVE